MFSHSSGIFYEASSGGQVRLAQFVYFGVDSWRELDQLQGLGSDRSSCGGDPCYCQGAEHAIRRP